MRATSIAPLLCLLAVATPVLAQQDQPAIKLGGKTLELATTGEQRMQAKIDGEILEEDAFIEVETSFDDGSRGAAVLLVSDGGNGCPGNYVVISVDDGKAVATDPFGTCSDNAEASADQGIITVRFPPIGGRDGTVYHWSFAKGLEPPAAEPFQPKPGTSWANANALIGKYPWEALDNADVLAAFKALLGPDYETFTNYFGKGDPMDATPEGVIVGDCFDDSAEDSTNLLIGIDPTGKRVFVAMQDGGEAPRLYPAQEQWPASLQEQLKQWPQ
ncbi:hypothetical protein [Dongia sp.]|uniref:hypothetical protein n=1 Tax=Dongia sp. TaxID=1977262 RepID=UPI00375222F0